MTGDVNDVMPGRDGLRILGDFEKSCYLRFEAWRGELGFESVLRRGVRALVELRADAGRTVSIVKIVSLSPRVKKPKLKSS